MTDKKQQFDKYQPTPPRPYIPQPSYQIEYIKELLQAASEGNIATINKIISEQKLPIDVKDEKGRTLLHIIIDRTPDSSPEEQKIEIINKIPNILMLSDVADVDGITPLMLAAKYQCTKIIDILYINKVNVQLQDTRGLTALHYAIIGYQYPCKNIAKDTVTTIEDDMTISQAIEQFLGGAREIQQQTRPYELQVFDENYMYPITIPMCIKTSIDTVKTLLKYGANINATDKHNLTAFFYALQNKDVNMIKFLLSYGEVSKDAPISAYGETPLQYFNSIFKAHLQSFTTDDYIINTIKSFFKQMMQPINDYLTENTAYKIDNIDEIMIRVFIILNEQMRYLFTGEKRMNICDFMGNEDDKTRANALSVESANVIDAYCKLSKVNGHLSKHNKWWGMYETMLNDAKYIPYMIYIEKQINTGGIIDGAIYTKIKEYIDDYHQLPLYTKDNHSLKDIFDLIVNQYINIIGHSFYRESLRIMLKERNIPVEQLQLFIHEFLQDTNFDVHVLSNTNTSMAVKVCKLLTKIYVDENDPDKALTSVEDIITRELNIDNMKAEYQERMNRDVVPMFNNFYKPLTEIVIKNIHAAIDVYFNYLRSECQLNEIRDVLLA